MAYKKAADGVAKKGKTEGKNLGDSGPTVAAMKGKGTKSSGGGATPMGSKAVAVVAEQNNTIVLDCKTAKGGVWDSGWHSISELEGVTRSAIMSDVSYSATTSANPTIGPYLVLAVGNWASATSTSIRFAVQIDFKAKWYAPTTLAQS